MMLVSPLTLTCGAFAFIFAHVTASDVSAPESDASKPSCVLTSTAKSAPSLKIWEFNA
jgi:hypothetical protein